MRNTWFLFWWCFFFVPWQSIVVGKSDPRFFLFLLHESKDWLQLSSCGLRCSWLSERRLRRPRPQRQRRLSKGSVLETTRCWSFGKIYVCSGYNCMMDAGQQETRQVCIMCAFLSIFKRHTCNEHNNIKLKRFQYRSVNTYVSTMCVCSICMQNTSMQAQSLALVYPRIS